MAVILEGIITTRNADGTVNIAPMGPIVEPSMRRLVLRPFDASLTYANLVRSRQGVFHVTDDVLLVAQAAVGEPDPPPRLHPAVSIEGSILSDACRWYEFRVESISPDRPRCEMIARVVGSGALRDFLGFNRAKHAVVEAAILATRVGLLPAEEIAASLARLAPLVDKTGGPAEHAAFALLERFVRKSTGLPAGDQ